MTAQLARQPTTHLGASTAPAPRTRPMVSAPSHRVPETEAARIVIAASQTVTVLGQGSVTLCCGGLAWNVGKGVDDSSKAGCCRLTYACKGRARRPESPSER